MARPKDEPLEKTLSRMARSAAPPARKAKPPKKDGSGAVAESEKRQETTATAEQLIASTALFPAPPPPSSSSTTAPNPIPGTTLNGDAWPLAAGGTLRVGETSFEIVVNPPTALRASLAAAAPLCGLPVAPVVDALFADQSAARYTWFRRHRLGEGGKGGGAKDTHSWEEIEGANEAAFVPDEGDVGCFLKVVVTPARRVPGSSSSFVLGAPIAAESSVPVAKGPALPPWHGRVAEEEGQTSPSLPFSTPRFASPSSSSPSPSSPSRLRVLTYNLLADQYAASDYAKAHLFSHCHPRYLEADYRRSLAAAEVARYGADVVCLQEVDERCFSDVLVPLLRAEGYEGRFTGKASTVREGSATFWLRERFEVGAERDVVLKEVFGKLWEGSGGGGGGEGGRRATTSNDKSSDGSDASDPLSASSVAARHSALLPALRSSAWLRESLSKVSTVAQVTLLVPRRRKKEEVEEEKQPGSESACGGGGGGGGGPLLVTNTHLFFHPSAPHVRTLHVQAMLTEAADVSERWQTQEKKAKGDSNDDGNATKTTKTTKTPKAAERPAALFCGDLNSDLNDGVPGVVELLREGTLPGGYWDWALGASFRYDDDGVGPPVSDAEKRVVAEEAEEEEEEKKKTPYGSDGTPLPKPVTPVPGNGDGLCPPDLRLPFDFFPADSLRTPCTNYVRGYSGLLDFVWVDRGALKRAEGGEKEEQELFLNPPPPPVAALGGFIPNERFPSDHLAVIADLEWLPVEQRNPSSQPPEASRAGRGPAAPWPPPLPPQTLRLPEVRLRDEKLNSAVEPDAATSAAAVMMLSGRGRTVSAADPTALPACVLALRAGEVLAVPTDTLYGIAACACSPSAVAKVYAAKGRGSSAPLAVCVADAGDVPGVADVSGLPRGLLEAMLPGPVTLLLKRRKEEGEGEEKGGEEQKTRLSPPSRLCAALNPGTPTVGVRVPDSQFIRSLAKAHGGPIALTSANESGRPPALEAAECHGDDQGGEERKNGIAGECAAVVDGGRVPASGREGSTIIDLSSVDFDSGLRSFSIVREGQAAGKVREMLSGRFGLVEMV